ncbi:MAG: type II secretion system protein [Betaproteobacteria bacterium]|nr:MAG: type II secretion system protein [Betaproteobacteria bacterium]
MACSIKPVRGRVIDGPAQKNFDNRLCSTWPTGWMIVMTTPLEESRRQRGFTLIELLVAITVLVILSSTAATSYLQSTFPVSNS